MDNEALQNFLDFAAKLKGDEKGEAQLFCDRLFRAFGHGGIIEANGTLEARIKFSEGGTKFADCLWVAPGRPGVLIEMKKRSEKDLKKHFPQARDYWIQMNPEVVIGPGAQKPEYIVLCNFDRILIYRQLTQVDDVALSELPDRVAALNFLLPQPRAPIFHHNVEAISRDVAGTLGDLFKYLVFERKEDPTRTRHFLLQCVLALFSEDFGLLPNGLFSELVRECQSGVSSYDLLGALFRQMASPERAKAGRFKDVRYFNGGLFNAVDPIELDSHALGLLARAGARNWRSVNPGIFGALFEGTMDAQERHTFGAHFTSEADILKVIGPSIIVPWQARINKAKTYTELLGLLSAIGSFKVLDPACGCGNFLFVAFRVLKDLEMQIIEKIAENFSRAGYKTLGISVVTTRQFFGMDVLPTAVEIAKMTMMLAKELAADAWNERIGKRWNALGLDYDQGLPLDNLDDNILCQDALLTEWPAFDVVVGNPPYQSKNKMKREMDNAYLSRLRERYPDVPGRADYCVYWYRKAHELMAAGQRAGLVGTNTIRQNDSRVGGLDYIVNNGGTIVDAVSTQVWSGEAAVHVSIVNWVKGEEPGLKRLVFQNGDSTNSPFEYHEVQTIGPALSRFVDVTPAASLAANRDSGCCYQGQTHGHTGFLLDRAPAEALLAKDPRYAQVVFPFLTGDELLGQKDSLPTRYVIDFRNRDVFEAARYDEVFRVVKSTVFPDRDAKARAEAEKNEATLAAQPNARVNHHHANFLRSWWRLTYERAELMAKLDSTCRYIACSRVTKRPIFEFVAARVHPNDALQVFPIDDDYSFGVLQSVIHCEWFRAKCSTLKGDWRYTSDTVFDSFPWPQTPSLAQIRAVAEAARSLRLKRREIMARDGLSLRELYRLVETTPANPVSELQLKLDDAVRKAYGWTKKEDILSGLLALNLRLVAAERQGVPIVGPGLPPVVVDRNEFVSDDAVGAG